MVGAVAQRVPGKKGLRERRKERTRRTIIDVALELFVSQGYQATTLAQIADGAEISPTTLHTYFPTKDEILFSGLDAVVSHARARILERDDSEPLIEALIGWMREVPSVTERTGVSPIRRQLVVNDDASLQALERLRFAALEDVLAEAFASDLGETADDLRSRLMASITVNGMRAVWFWWYRHADGNVNAWESLVLDETYLIRLITAAESAIEELPMPPEHLGPKTGPA
jgi:AcrR family transcriptional regulator